MIKLRNRVSRSPVVGTVEREEFVQLISEDEGAEMRVDDQGKRIFEFNWSGRKDSDCCSETVTDDNGERQFWDDDGIQIPESQVEPYVEGMSDLRFYSLIDSSISGGLVKLNATESALIMLSRGEDPAKVGLDNYGRDLPDA